jgi:hypothetical protein
VNAMAMAVWPSAFGRLHDPLGGQVDLKRRRLRPLSPLSSSKIRADLPRGSLRARLGFGSTGDAVRRSDSPVRCGLPSPFRSATPRRDRVAGGGAFGLARAGVAAEVGCLQALGSRVSTSFTRGPSPESGRPSLGVGTTRGDSPRSGQGGPDRAAR